MEKIITQALQDAEKTGATGSDNTPFILSKIRELTHGDTIIVNRRLIEENVVRGTKVSIELAALELQGHGASVR